MKTKQLLAYYPLLVSNIRATYYAALQYPTLYQSGLKWYITANNQCCKIAQRHHILPDTVYAVVAALSPGNRWERNLVDAEVAIKAVLAGGNFDSFKSASYFDNKVKAFEIIKGISPALILGGNKVISFYKNLCNPSDKYIVTVDGHGISLALGKKTALNKVPQLTDKQYLLFADAYRQATSEINLDSLETEVLPCQVQAVTWSYWRLIHGVTKY